MFFLNGRRRSVRGREEAARLADKTLFSKSGEKSMPAAAAAALAKLGERGKEKITVGSWSNEEKRYKGEIAQTLSRTYRSSCSM